MQMTLEVVDSHTEGEPTRVVTGGWPALRTHEMRARRDEMRSEWDHLRRAVVCEPRGHDALVGAILTPPVSAEASAGVVFCNTAGYLDMCGHGSIGVVVTLHALGRVKPGVVTLDTPAGPVRATLHDGGEVEIENVPCRVTRVNVTVDVPTIGAVTGDVAYGGNWFFLTHLPGIALHLRNVEDLLRVTIAIRAALRDAGVTGDGGAEIDHIELYGPPQRDGANAKNFVLCPGNAYDRSPCGTGTSAKMATLVAREELAPGTTWVQEGILGSTFRGRIERRDDALIPYIRGSAFVTSRATLELDERDPFRYGL